MNDTTHQSGERGDARLHQHTGGEQPGQKTDPSTPPHAADAVMAQASETMETVKSKALEIKEEVVAGGARAAGEIGKAVDAQKSAGADRLEGVAKAVESAADELDRHIPGSKSYVDGAAAGVRSLSESMRNRSINEMVARVNGFARSQPVAFFGATVLAGFALSRFLKSTSEHAVHGDGGGMQS